MFFRGGQQRCSAGARGAERVRTPAGMASLGIGQHLLRRRGAGRSSAVERRNLLTVCRWEFLTLFILCLGGKNSEASSVCDFLTSFFILRKYFFILFLIQKLILAYVCIWLPKEQDYILRSILFKMPLLRDVTLWVG